MTKVMGIVCRIDQASAVTLSVSGFGQEFKVEHRGSARSHPSDEEDVRRRGIVEALLKVCTEVNPEFLFVQAPDADKGTLQHAFLVGSLVGRLEAQPQFAGRVTCVRASSWAQALGCSSDSPQHPAHRIFGHRIGRNAEEDTAGALAIFGAKKGRHLLLQRRTDEAMRGAA